MNEQSAAAYTTGGPVDAGFRIIRHEEEAVWKHLVQGDLYVPLCCGRQSGKTTTMYYLRERLRREGFGVAYLYLGGRHDLSAPRFYNAMCSEIVGQLSSCIDKDTASLNVATVEDQLAFGEVIEWIAKNTGRCGKVVIMLDEVGSVPSAFASSFWGGVRSFFTRKGIFRRITFLFAGELDMYVLATGNNSPLANVCVTPFMELPDFTETQVNQLVAAGLFQCDAVGRAIFRWTAGHPYLSQKACVLIQGDVRSRPSSWPATVETTLAEKADALVDEVIGRAFPQEVDSNLVHLENSLERMPELRKIVRRVLQEGSVGFSPKARSLGVIGLLKLSDDRRYRVRNAIYERMLRNYFEDYVD
jgi:hypothetical protein